MYEIGGDKTNKQREFGRFNLALAQPANQIIKNRREYKKIGGEADWAGRSRYVHEIIVGVIKVCLGAGVVIKFRIKIFVKSDGEISETGA